MQSELTILPSNHISINSLGIWSPFFYYYFNISQNVSIDKCNSFSLNKFNMLVRYILQTSMRKYVKNVTIKHKLIEQQLHERVLMAVFDQSRSRSACAFPIVVFNEQIYL